MSDAVREALFLRIIWESFTGKALSVPTLLHEDNMGAIAWGHNPVDFARSKHIEVSVSAVREQIQEFKTVKLQYIPTVRQLADTLTKNTVPAIFTALRKEKACWAFVTYSGANINVLTERANIRYDSDYRIVDL
jgi:hypothetical protein